MNKSLWITYYEDGRDAGLSERAAGEYADDKMEDHMAAEIERAMDAAKEAEEVF